MILLDSDDVTDVLRDYPPALRWLTSVKGNPIALPGYVMLEVLAGCRTKAEQRRVDGVLSTATIIWPGARYCDHALEVYRRFHLSHGIGILDSLIASTALGLGIPLHTFNTKHYSTVPGLKLSQPYAR